MKCKSIFNDTRVRVLLISVLSMAIYGGKLLLTRNQTETDNAIVRCDIVDIASEINVPIQSIHFEDNQFVRKGDLLVAMFDASLQAEKNQREAELQAARATYESALKEDELASIEVRGDIKKRKANLEAAGSSLNAMQREVEEAQANLNLAATKLASDSNNAARVKELHSQGFLSVRSYEDALRDQQLSLSSTEAVESRLKLTKAKLQSTRSNLREADVNYEQATSSFDIRLANSKASTQVRLRQVEIAEAKFKLAGIALEKTRVKALKDGYVTNRRMAVGNYVEVGQPIASITSCQEKAWIEANFKETQLENIRPGQKVVITVDTYPGRVFEGRVESVSNGSGSMFSVLPPENGTGNFTKVVQRFPTKIAVLPVKGNPLRVGMSAVVTVLLDQ